LLDLQAGACYRPVPGHERPERQRRDVATLLI
jgi:hypothetical protein